MKDLIQRLRDASANSVQTVLGSTIFCEAATALEQQQAEIERLRGALQIPKWKSCHKDNMEFSATISCYAMDKIRAALAAEKDDDE